MENHYEILQIKQSATIPEIKAAHRTLALIFHPDKCCNNNNIILPRNYNEHNNLSLDETNVNNGIVIPPTFYMIQEAYETLIDPIKRREYDVSLENLKEQQKFYAHKENKSSHNDTNTSTTPIIKLSEMTIEKCCVVLENANGEEEDIMEEEDVYTYMCQCGDSFDVFKKDIITKNDANIWCECYSCSLCISIHVDSII